ncbi:PQ-loop repeat-containing protein [Sporobolomyces salmoneus]|uniref:PQ-loop repeat-containing protein n=1 Tax=Sporobolomyces salmoneus TaxID=183962 RepID=UPI003178699A
MSESSDFKLTSAQLYSSLLGYGGIGAAIACFIPLILSNAAKRRNGMGGGFLALWLVGDVFNIIGLIVLKKALLTQIFLATWYAIADFFLLIELWLWGHPAPFSWKPTPAATCKKKLEDEARSPWIRWFNRQFEDWTLWDNLKLVLSLIILGIAWFGLYTTIQLHSTKGDFELPIPTSHDGLSIDHRTKYWIAETPWIAGAIIPIVFDAILVYSIERWQRAWNANPYKNDPEKHKRLQHLEDDIEHTKAELAYLEVEVGKVQVGISALEDHKKVQAKIQKKRKERDAREKSGKRFRRNRVLKAVGLSEKGQLSEEEEAKKKGSSLYEEWKEHGTVLHPEYPTPASERLKAVEEKNGRRRMKSRPDSAASASDSSLAGSSDREALIQPRTTRRSSANSLSKYDYV